MSWWFGGDKHVTCETCGVWIDRDKAKKVISPSRFEFFYCSAHAPKYDHFYFDAERDVHFFRSVEVNPDSGTPLGYAPEAEAGKKRGK